MAPQRGHQSVVGARPNKSAPPRHGSTFAPVSAGGDGRWVARAAALVLALLLAWNPADPTLAADPTQPRSLEVSGEGIAVAAGVLTLPGSPDIARHLLTDAWNWPDLFVSPVWIRSVTRVEDRAVTDMYLSPSIFLGELHMVVETRQVSRHRLETRLVRGDVRRYAHVWELTPQSGAPCTHAVLEMTMQLKTWMPNWLLRWLMWKEFDGHLERVMAEAARRAGDADACASVRQAERPAG